jgi:phosphohistidine phosphatase
MLTERPPARELRWPAMLLLLFRHGIAEDRVRGRPDVSRRLTPKGRRRVRAAAAGLARFAPRPDVILTSPKVRAAETAELLGKALERQPQTLAELADGPASTIVRALAHRHETVVLLVGHEPSLGQTVRLLCDIPIHGPAITLRKAGCACVQIDHTALRRGKAADGRLLWLATAGLLRRLARRNKAARE